MRIRELLHKLLNSFNCPGPAGTGNIKQEKS